MTKDWATATFDANTDVSALVYKVSVQQFPSGDDANLLVPVHAYEYSDHFAEKGAQMVRDSHNDDYRVTSAYFGGRNPADTGYDAGWGEGRIVLDDGTMTAWFQPPGGSWTQTGRREDCERDHFVEFDTMTEIQYDDDQDLPAFTKGQVATQWRWVRDVDGNWYRPEDVLSLQDGSNNDGSAAQIDWLLDQDDGTYYFFHYVE